MSGMAPARAPRYALLADGGLELEAEAALLPAVGRWLPLSSELLIVDGDTPAAGPVPGESAPLRIRVQRGAPPAIPAAGGTAGGGPLLRLWSVGAWRVEGRRAFVLSSSRCGVGGHADLDGGVAELAVPDPEDGAARAALFSALTLAAALLLLARRRALMHAAAVAPPGGRALLLAGDARSGKSTSVANLMSAGWEYLSDDQIVLREGGAGDVVVEGWPRRFHLDTGWRKARVTGKRETVDPAGIGSGAFRRVARLGAVLFPQVDPGAGTRLVPIPAARALALLIRQSPWLLADPASSGAVLACLVRAASLPAYRLFLDRDTYGDPARLAALLAPVVA